MLIGNKCDIENERKISSETALEKAKSLNIPLMETSALDATNIQKVFEIILKEMYKEIKKEKENDKNDEDNKIEGIKLDTNEQNEKEKPKKKGCC